MVLVSDVFLWMFLKFFINLLLLYSYLSNCTIEVQLLRTDIIEYISVLFHWLRPLECLLDRIWEVLLSVDISHSKLIGSLQSEAMKEKINRKSIQKMCAEIPTADIPITKPMQRPRRPLVIYECFLKSTSIWFIFKFLFYNLTSIPLLGV